MKLDPIGVAVPFFMALIGLEWVISVASKKKVYRLNDTLTDLSCGIGDQLLGFLAKGTLAFAYVWIYENLRIYTFEANWWVSWVFAMLGVDFFHYWYHRFSHRTQLGWATHVVHHQSEEYNLAVALRQSWFAKFYSWVFYIPLAYLGVPVELYVASFAFNLLYQFWVHTRLINRLPAVFEWVFNTPSHHRVHHAINTKYLDKNYSGVLILWDRIFGTFEPEVEEPLYGTLKPIQSWSAAWANVSPCMKLLKDSLSEERLFDKLTLWARPPGWDTRTARVIQVPKFPPDGREYDANPRRTAMMYALIQFGPISLVLTTLLLIPDQWPSHVAWIAVIYGFWTLVSVAAIYEERPWVRSFEVGRLLGVLLAGLWILSNYSNSTIGLVTGGIVSYCFLGLGIFVVTHFAGRSRVTA